MAVEGPHTSVGGVELHDNVAVGPHLLHIAALRVVGVCDVAIPRAGTFSEDVHIVAVKMYGVTGSCVSPQSRELRYGIGEVWRVRYLRRRAGIADNDPHARVCIHVPDVPLRVESRIPFMSSQKCRVVVVNPRALAVKIPQRNARAVGEQ